MSEEKKELALIPVGDFTIKDLELIQKFKDDGMLGLHTLKDTDVERMLSLYMDGKSYRQVAMIANIKKVVVMFLAHKFGWYELRRDYLDELHASIKDKVIESKLESQEFLLELSQFYKKRIGKDINKYLKTDNEEYAKKIDGKDIGTYLKVTELLYRLTNENIGTNNDKALVGLNGLGEGMTITKTGTNSVEITPKSPVASKLKLMADFKREQEKASQPAPKPHDIEVENNLTEKESKNENS